MKTTTTTIERDIHNITSSIDNVKMEVAPNNVLHTSPARFVDTENKFISKYPIAREPTEIIAMAASPLIFLFCWVLRSNTAQPIVTGVTKIKLFVKFKTEAMEIAPKATWDKPSPIYEKRFSTKVTPIREEHRAISTPTIKVYLTNG